jgi:hypothetical protein
MPQFSYWRDKADQYHRLAEACKDAPAMAFAWAALADAHSRAVSELEGLEAKKTPVHRRTASL